MDDESVLQSLKTGKYSADRSCWETNTRFLLRLTLHATIAFLCLLILLQVVLMSVYYHRLSDILPVSITPYGSVVPDNSTLIPCVFPRNAEPLPGDIDCQTQGFCPVGWSCSIVADEETQVNTFVCLNNAYSCGDLHYCTNYITSLTNATTATLPSKLSNIEVSETSYLLAVIPTFFGLFLLAFMWIGFIFWSAIIGDPFSPNSLEDTQGFSRSCYEQYQKLFSSEVTSVRQCRINILITFPLIIILIIGGSVFLASGTSPSLHDLTAIATADCFADSWLYLFSSSMLGWITGFFVAEIACMFALLFFFSVYTIKPFFHSIWDARVFLTIFLLMSIIIAIGVTIELVSVIIMAT